MKPINYTFSVSDKQLYMLYRGITVTTRLAQASSVSSYGRNTFTRGAFYLCFVRRPFTRPACLHVLVLRRIEPTLPPTRHLRRQNGPRHRPDKTRPPRRTARSVSTPSPGSIRHVAFLDPLSASVPKVRYLQSRRG
jgi:hypothetical protein